MLRLKTKFISLLSIPLLSMVLVFCGTTKTTAQNNSHYGTIHFDGGKYVGQLKNGLYHGKGIQTWSNGDKYTGDFKAGARTGKGVYTWPDGNKYTGDFKMSKITGYGVKNFANGDKYEGYFKDGFKQGHGKITYSNGFIATGNFIKGIEDGHFDVIDSNSGKRLVVVWEMGTEISHKVISGQQEPGNPPPSKPKVVSPPSGHSWKKVGD